MIKTLTSAVLAAMIGSAAVIAPAAAQSVSINVGGDRGYHGDRHDRRVVEERRVVRERRPVRVVREQRCSTKTVVTHRHGERVVRKVRTCR